MEHWTVDTRNHSALKAKVIEALIEEFEQSGEEFTCRAAFISVVRASANTYASILHGLGYEFSKSKYFPITCARDNFCLWAANEYHERYFK